VICADSIVADFFNSIGQTLLNSDVCVMSALPQKDIACGGRYVGEVPTAEIQPVTTLPTASVEFY
jgi:hypothetical protein